MEFIQRLDLPWREACGLTMLRADSQRKAAVRSCRGPCKVILRIPCQARSKDHMHLICKAGALINGNLKGAF